MKLNVDESTKRDVNRETREGLKRSQKAKRKGSSSRQDPVGPPMHRATSGGDPELGIACVREQTKHRLDCSGVVFYRAEATAGQKGKSKGTG